MDYQRMAGEYLAEVDRLTRRVEQLRRSPRFRHEPDLWNRVGHLLEVRDDLRVTAHVLQRRAASCL